MRCTSPLKAYQPLEGGQVVFRETGDSRSLLLPCGSCQACRLERSRIWATRVMHEASCWPANQFITLTYNDEHYPDYGSLDYSDYQLFFKRYRKAYCGVGADDTGCRPIRFYMCGEYGKKLLRPHFHAAVFNHRFSDCKIWKRTKSGSIIYRSEQLEKLWPHGFSSVGELTFESAAYIARYIMKKQSDEQHYERFTDTGEILQLKPEFTRMSLKPGIGGHYYKKYGDKLHNQDFVVVNGKQCKLPRYYDKQLEKLDPYRLDQIKCDRVLNFYQNPNEILESPLECQRVVTDATVKKLKRSI